MPCDKLQSSNTRIKIVFINNTELITEHDRKVSII
jgi:hypothetical protein